MVSSFFDIYIEVSTDGGGSWSAAELIHRPVNMMIRKVVGSGTEELYQTEMLSLDLQVATPGGTVLVYKSLDLRNWEYVGPLCIGRKEETGDMWECPSLFSLGDKHVLTCNALPIPVEPARMKTIYFLGTYQDGRFQPEIQEDLDRFKQLLEAGEIATIFGQTSGRANEVAEERQEQEMVLGRGPRNRQREDVPPASRLDLDLHPPHQRRDHRQRSEVERVQHRRLAADEADELCAFLTIIGDALGLLIAENGKALFE